MFGSFSYLVYMLIFTITPIMLVWLINYKNLLKNLRIIFLVALLGIVYQLIADPFAESWHAWFFSKDRILGLWIFNFPVENMLFFILVPIAISSVVLTLLDLKSRGKLQNFLKSLKNEWEEVRK